MRKFKAIVIWGTEGVDAYNEEVTSEEDSTQKWLKQHPEYVHSYEFNTQDERAAFIKGISEAMGWEDYQIFNE